MPIKKNNPVYRTKCKLTNLEIVQRNPSSTNHFLVSLLIAGLVATVLWLIEYKQVPESVVENLPSGQLGTNDQLKRLHISIKQGEIKEIQRIVADVDETVLNTVINGMTPVMIASSIGNERVVELLLKSGANPNKRGSSQRTALQYAAEKNHIFVARILLDYGADIDAYDNSRLTPLMMAADRGYTDLGILLIESGADVNIQHVQGWTALIDAARNGKLMLVQHLLAEGADRDILANNGWRAIDFARENKHEDVVMILSK